MMRFKALDLGCCAGGASEGLYQAGFDVTGVDKIYHKNYRHNVLVADALKLDQGFLSLFDFIWASPHCQQFSVSTPVKNRLDHPNDIDAFRQLLASSNALTCIENVPGAPLRPDVIMTGCQFGLKTYRRRHFELNFPMLWLPPGKRFGPKTVTGAVTVAGHGGGKRDGNTQQWKAAMGIDWMSARELSQAVPPAYAKTIGEAAIRILSQGQSDRLDNQRPGETS